MSNRITSYNISSFDSRSSSEESSEQPADDSESSVEMTQARKKEIEIEIYDWKHSKEYQLLSNQTREETKERMREEKQSRFYISLV